MVFTSAIASDLTFMTDILHHPQVIDESRTATRTLNCGYGRECCRTLLPSVARRTACVLARADGCEHLAPQFGHTAGPPLLFFKYCAVFRSDPAKSPGPLAFAP